MKRLAIVSGLVAALMVPQASGANAPGRISEEGCQAFNPGQPKCTFTTTHTSDSPVQGAAGVGTWVVKIVNGKKKTTVKSPPSGEPTALEFTYSVGDKVTATAVSPGAVVIVGHAD